MKDTQEAVRGCRLWQAANRTSHTSLQPLKTIKTESPFDVMCIDVWKPGIIPSKGCKRTPTCQVALTGVVLMTAFAGVD